MYYWLIFDNGQLHSSQINCIQVVHLFPGPAHQASSSPLSPSNPLPPSLSLFQMQAPQTRLNLQRPARPSSSTAAAASASAAVPRRRLRRRGRLLLRRRRRLCTPLPRPADLPSDVRPSRPQGLAGDASEASARGPIAPWPGESSIESLIAYPVSVSFHCVRIFRRANP